MNVAYLVIAHKMPAQLARMVRRLDAPGVSFYVHVDATAPEPVYHAMTEAMAGMPNVRFVPRHRCHWGGLGMVTGALECMRAALAASPRPDYALLLSGQDYPLVPHNELVAAIETAGRRVHMEWFPLPDPRWEADGTGWIEGGLERFENWYVRVGGRTIPLPRNANAQTRTGRAWSALIRKLGLKRRFPRGLAPFGGSAFWGMPAGCLEYVCDFADADPAFVRYFEHVFAPDEMFFHTVVLNSPWREAVVNDDLRFIDWSGNGAHPEVLTSDRFDELMASGDLFARKFDPDVDAAVLDRIDAALDAATPSPPTDR